MEHSKPALNKLARTYFLLQGIGGLLPWNGILSTLDFYDMQFPGRKAAFIFPIANLFCGVMINFFMAPIAKKFSLNQRIAGTNFLIFFMLIAVPIIAIIFPKTLFGYTIILVVLSILGILNSINNSSVYGLAGYFPPIYMSDQNTGTGIGGIIPNLLRILIIVFIPSDHDQTDGKGILIYYGVAGLFILTCIAIHYKFITSEYAFKKIGIDSINRLLDVDETLERENIILNTNSIEQDHKEESNSQGEFKKAFLLFREIRVICLLMVINLAITLTLFPGVMLMNPLPTIDSAWKTVNLQLAFNVCDTIGKYLTSIKAIVKRKIVILLTLIRFLFFFTFIIQVVTTNFAIIDTTWFAFVNSALFGLTNGYVCSSLFILGPVSVEGEKKEIAGFLLFNCLNLGILLGSIFAYPLSYL